MVDRSRLTGGQRTTRRIRRRKSNTQPVEPAPQPFDDLVQLIQRNPPNNHFRDGAYIHVSDAVYKCMRMIALSKHLDQPIRGEPILDSRGVTFATGEAIQQFVTRRLAGNAPGMLWGNFKCRCENVVVERATLNEARKHERCGLCGTLAENYHEVVFKDEQRKITGSVDIILKLPSGHYYPVECKSIAGSRWADIGERALPEHLNQSLFYWKLMNESGLPMLDTYSILYVKKEFHFASPYKEVIVNAPQRLSRIDDLLEEVEELQKYLESQDPEDIPPRSVCSTPLSPGARECPFALQCFALDPPPARESDDSGN